MPEKVLVEHLLKAVQSPLSEPPEAAGPTSPAAPPAEPPQHGQQRGSGLIIP